MGSPAATLSAVPLSEQARSQLLRARVLTAMCSAVVFVFLLAAVGIGAAVAEHTNWTVTALLAIVGGGATIAFGICRTVHINRDLGSGTVTRYSGPWREQLNRPLGAAALRVKLPGTFMLLRSSTKPVIASAVEAGNPRHWTRTAGHLEYSTASRLLLSVSRAGENRG